MLGNFIERIKKRKHSHYAQTSPKDVHNGVLRVNTSTQNSISLSDVIIRVNEISTFVNRGIIKGKIISKGGTVINYGTIEGTVEVAGTLKIKENSSLCGSIICEKLFIMPNAIIEEDLNDGFSN